MFQWTPCSWSTEGAECRQGDPPGQSAGSLSLKPQASRDALAPAMGCDSHLLGQSTQVHGASMLPPRGPSERAYMDVSTGQIVIIWVHASLRSGHLCLGAYKTATPPPPPTQTLCKAFWSSGILEIGRMGKAAISSGLDAVISSNDMLF